VSPSSQGLEFCRLVGADRFTNQLASVEVFFLQILLRSRKSSFGILPPLWPSVRGRQDFGSQSLLLNEAFAFGEEGWPKCATISEEIENDHGCLPFGQSEDELASLQGSLEILGANGFVSLFSLFPHCERGG
jgi:hypothetical protein